MAKQNLQTPMAIRDISWLSFNARVLQEAEDTSHPLVQRFQFLGIFSNNLDEFFRVRVATLRRMKVLGAKAKNIYGVKPEDILDEIKDIVLEQQARFESVYDELLLELEQEKIFLLTENQLSDSQGEYVRSYFREKVRTAVVPVMLNQAKKFPYIKDDAIYLGVRITRTKPKFNVQFAIIEIPTTVVPRFILLPEESENKYFMMLDDVIRYCLDEVFAIFNPETIEAYTFKINRDAELDIDEDISKGLLEKIQEGVEDRKKGAPVRFIYDLRMPSDLFIKLTRKLGIKGDGNLLPGGRYHNFKDFMGFPDFGRYDLVNPPFEPILNHELRQFESLGKAIEKKDYLLHFPYNPFSTFIDLLREASIDPEVSEIKVTQYRVARHSKVLNALLNAAQNGKKVTVVVELRARFDESSNIYWSEKLQEVGANVIFGVSGLKVHAKLALIIRKNKKKPNIACVGTGNFNESSAKVFSDSMILTAKPEITDDIVHLFEFFEKNYLNLNLKHMLHAPLTMRSGIKELIQTEIENAKAGKDAFILLKMNSFMDQEMTQLMYDASQAGVKVDLIVRGICSVKPGIKGISDNIRVISILDKFLEHARIFTFCNNGDSKVYLSSGDLMYRNLDSRIELVSPVVDKDLRDEIMDYLNIQLCDNVKARNIDSEQKNEYIQDSSNQEVRAQTQFYDYLHEKYPL